MTQIFNALKSLIAPHLGKAATALGEPESKISSASHAILAGLLARMAKHGSNDGLSTSLKMAGQSPIMDNLDRVFSGHDTECEENTTNNFLHILLGSKADHFVSSVSTASGISKGNAGRLTAMVGAAASAFLGKQLHDGTSATDLVKELEKEQSDFHSAIPAGVGAALGLSAVAARDTSDKTHTVHRMLTEDDKKKYGPKKKGLGWLLWLLLALVLLLLIIFGWRSCHKKVEVPAVAPVAVVVPPAPGLFELTLPNGVKLNVNRGSMEDRMVQFLLSDTYKNGNEDVMRKHWFEFEDVDFVRGSATELIDAAKSEPRLINVATILKAFPAANIRIGGNADKTGGEPYNQELSEQRAIFIDRFLDNHAIEEHRITTRGFGSENAVFPATATAEEAASDRDIAFRFQKL